MKRIRRNILGEKRGFTLGELLIVVAILAVTAAIGFLAVANAKKDKTAMANDETAKQIYLAAQNRMLQMKEYGEWEIYTQTHDVTAAGADSWYGGTFAAVFNSAKPSDYEYWRTVSGGTAFNATDMRILSSDDFQKNGKSQLLGELLKLGSLEDVIKNKHYFIEYNYKTATVYGVFYSEDSYTSGDLINASQNQYYVNKDEDKKGRQTDSVSASVARETRKTFTTSGGSNVILGYFGGGMISDITYADMEMPEVIVYNGENLVLHIEKSDIDLGGSGSTATASMTIQIRGVTSGVTHQYEVVNNPAYTATNLSPSPYCLNPVGNEIPEKYLHVFATTVSKPEEELKGQSLSIILDSWTSIQNGEDNSGKNFRFAANFKECLEQEGSLLPGEDLEITVMVSSTEKVGLPGVHTVKTNSLFATVTDTKIDQTSDGRKYLVGGIEINAARHLMNLSKASGVDLTDKNVFKDSDEEHRTTNGGFCRAYLSSNISFDGKGEGLFDFPDVAQATYGAGVYQPIDLELCTDLSRFYLTGRADESTQDGPVYRIYDLCFEGEYASAGLFGSVTQKDKKDTDAPINPKLTVSDLGIVQADGGQMTRFAAQPVKADSGSINLGALVGYAACEVSIDRCYSTVRLIAAPKSSYDNKDLYHYNFQNKTHHIGGLVGRADGALTITNSYVSGRTTGKNYQQSGSTADYDICFHAADAGSSGTSGSTADVGGLAGSAGGTVTITDSYSVAAVGNRIRYTTEEGEPDNYYKNDMTTGTYNIGGLIGRTDSGASLAMSNSYFYGCVDIPDKIYLNSNEANISLGGLIGNFEGDINSRTIADTCSYIKEYLCISDVEKTNNGKAHDSSLEEEAAITVKMGTTVKTYDYDAAFNGTEPGTPGARSYTGQISLPITPVTQDPSFVTKAYDKKSTTNNGYESTDQYPFNDVTGLGHHYGDWSRETPAFTITLEPGLGVTELKQPAAVDSQNWSHPLDQSLNEITDKWFINIPAGSTSQTFNIESVLSGKVVHKSGYQDLACKIYVSQIKTADEGWEYTTLGMDAVITVNAGAIVPVKLSCAGFKAETESEVTTNSDYQGVFGRGDVSIQVNTVKSDGTTAQSYDSSITVCYIWGVKTQTQNSYSYERPDGVAAIPLVTTPDWNKMCIVNNLKNGDSPVCDYYANLLKPEGTRAFGTATGCGIAQFTLKTDDSNYMKSGFIRDAADDDANVTGHMPYLNNRSYYGQKQYSIQAYAYAAHPATDTNGDDVVVPYGWLRTGLSEALVLSVATNRVKVKFTYDSSSAIAVNGTTSAKNMFGQYRIYYKEGIADYIETGSLDYYIEYEDSTYNTGSDGKPNPLTFYRTNGILSADVTAGCSDYNLMDPDQQDRFDLTNNNELLPKAVQIDAYGYTRPDVLFRGWQDAGKIASASDIGLTDWNYSKFDYEKTVEPDYYGPDLWINDSGYDSDTVADGEQYLIFEYKNIGNEASPSYQNTANAGVKPYLVAVNGTTCFQPESLDDIILKARWNRKVVPAGVDPEGGYWQ